MDNNEKIFRDENNSESSSPQEPVSVRPPYSFGRLYGKMTWIFFAIVMMVLGANVFAVVAMYITGHYFPEISSKNWYQTTVSGIAFYVVGVSLAVIMLLFSATDSARMTQTKMTFGKWMKYLCMTFAFMYTGNFVGTTVTTLLGKFLGHEITNPVQSALDGASWTASIIVMVIAAPILEELVFRKLLIDRMSMFGEKTAIFASALAFGLVHGNFSQFFYAFAIGLLFGYIYTKTKNVWYTVALHMVVNGVCGILTGYLAGKIDLDAVQSALERLPEAAPEEMAKIMSELMRFAVPSILLLIVSGLVFATAIVGIVFFAKSVRKVTLEPCKYDISAENVRKAAYLNVGIIILYVIMALSFIASLETQPEDVIAGAIIM